MPEGLTRYLSFALGAASVLACVVALWCAMERFAPRMFDWVPWVVGSYSAAGFANMLTLIYVILSLPAVALFRYVVGIGWPSRPPWTHIAAHWVSLAALTWALIALSLSSQIEPLVSLLFGAATYLTVGFLLHAALQRRSMRGAAS